ncbi:hypothetical protein BsWGS_04628 [Bradybaena similaris]
MSRRRKDGCFIRSFKVLASVTALLAWTGCLVENVGASKSELPSHQHQGAEPSDKGGLHGFEAEGVEVSLDTESFPLQKAGDSSCDVFYIIVSTIDGKVSALDLQKKGSLAWSVPADTRPLYSSSLANMEVIRNGKKMRLIPSLDGALYQFDGEKVEAIPVSAESLLSSTYKLGDDSMIVGSKDLRNFGVNLLTGKVQFACGSEGCSNYDGKADNEPLDGSSIIVLTRSTQVVRSVDVKNGQEKWNFSVGQHQVNLPSSGRSSDTYDSDDDNGDKEGYSIPVFSSFSDECSGEEKYTEDINYEDFLQLLVPEGRVVALSKADFSQVSWEHKFDSPIARAWLLRHGKLKPMSLFDGHHIPTLRAYIPEDMENVSMSQPLLYIGSHKKLLYIQASPQLESILKTFTTRSIGHYMEPKVKVSWRPYPNTAVASTPIFGTKRPQIAQDEQPKESDNTKESTSLTVWHDDYPFDTGYFLYPEIDSKSELERDAVLLENPQKSADIWLPVSIWVYWKEVAFFSVMLSILVHLLLSKFQHSYSTTNRCSLEAPESDTSKNSSSSHGMILSDSTSFFADKNSGSGDYVSRFATDFDCCLCLGKGGFGVVFEAVNKVDDQHYAVKRTVLPRSEGAKEKVLREVRALAKLEHIGIVRYFNAWVESPPAGWQEERDKLFNFSDMSGPESFSTYPGHHQSTEDQPQPTLAVKPQGKRTNVCAQHNLSFDRSDRLLDTDSVIFSSQAAASDYPPKHSGSGEFSVHPDLSKGSNSITSDADITDTRSHLVVFESHGLTDLGDFDSGSINDSKSSIPFSNYTSSSSGMLSHKTDHSHRRLSGDSVVFDSIGNRSSHNINELAETINSTDDSIVFEHSSMPDSNTPIEESKQGLSTNDCEHHTIDISLSSHGSENYKNREDKEKQVALPGNKLFLYIQMQLYCKETLKDWLSNNTLNRDRHTILDIFDQIVCAVDYVHSQGLMHRDLKPSNIFFTADGIVKVGDFGLATEVIVQQHEESEPVYSSLGKHTAEVGTTLYMSPEQIARKPYDLKVDIFSLGLIFLELWVPFSTDMERIRTLQDAKRHILPSRFRRELPAESELVCKMTSSDPAARPITGDILDHELFRELVPTRMGTRQHKRTISDNTNS